LHETRIIKKTSSFRMHLSQMTKSVLCKRSLLQIMSG